MKTIIRCASIQIIFYCISLLVSPLYTQNNLPCCAITYKLNAGGRLGDNIYSYCLAKWLAYKYKINFVYTPFPFSEFFTLSKYEKCLNDEVKKKFDQVQTVKSEKELSSKLNKLKKTTLFEIEYKLKIQPPNTIDTLKNMTDSGHGYQAIHWNQASWVYFLTHFYHQYGIDLKQALGLLITPHSFFLPSNVITIAVHVRKGGGYDAPLGSFQYLDECQNDLLLKNICPNNKKMADQDFPLKFPPEQYYVDQILKLSTLFKNVPLYVYVFTDDTRPDLVVERFKKRINCSCVEFACKLGKNSYQDCIIEDLYMMSLFDCLIRADSNFAWIAQIMGSHKIIIFPQKAEWENHMLMITDVGSIFYDQKNNNVCYLKFNNITIQHMNIVQTAFSNIKGQVA
jgi:hypothetical protein